MNTIDIVLHRARYETLIETTNALLDIVTLAQKEWYKAVDEREQAFKDLCHALEDAQDPEAISISDLCGCEDWYYDDEDVPVIRAKCGKRRGHRSRYHRQVDEEGNLWAEWSGPADERAPKGSEEQHAGAS